MTLKIQTTVSYQARLDLKKTGLALTVALLGLSSQALAHVEYYDLNQGVQIGDLTAAGKDLSTAQYGANPAVRGSGVGSATNTRSDRPLNDTTQWTGANQSYLTGIGSFSGVAYDAATGAGTATVAVNDVTDFGWGDGANATLGDTHKVDFFNFRLAQAADVTITWNISNSGSYYDSGFTLYNGVASYQGHDDSIDALNPKSGFPPHKVQNAFDTGSVTDAQGITAPFRNTAGAPSYTGQFNALAGWGDGNAAGNWSSVAYNTAVHVLRGSVGVDGYSSNAADTLQSLTISLGAGNYTIAASGALGAPGSQASFGLSNLNGVLTFNAIAKGKTPPPPMPSSTTPTPTPITPPPTTPTPPSAKDPTVKAPIIKKDQSISVIALTPTIITIGQATTASASADSGLIVSFSSSTSDICTISGTTLTAIAVGNCIIAANQAGDIIYNAAIQQTQSILVDKSSQAISFSSLLNLSIGETRNLSATSSSGLGMSFSSTTPGVCSVNGSTVTGIAVGNCIIAANQAGNASYFAAPQVTQTGTVSSPQATIPAPVPPTPTSNGYVQTLIFGNAPTILVGRTGIVSIPNASKLARFFTWRSAVTFTSATSNVCTVTGTTVTGIAEGVCIIVANQAGNLHYADAAPVAQYITIRR